MFLKISNRGSFNRKFLELVGTSTKRERIDDVTVIGNKGSGAKLSTIAALRLGLDLAVASSDYLGSYVLTYIAQDIELDGQTERQIVFRYWALGPDGKPVPTDVPWCMTVNAFQDWDQRIGDDDKAAFKVVREFICNAIDEDPEFEVEFVDRPHFVPPGETAVFMRYTEEIKAIFEDADMYFKFLPERLGDPKPRGIIRMDGVGEIHPKSDLNATRLFVLGVMVECSTSTWSRSLFDYSLYRKDLISEERIIKNMSAYLTDMGALIAGIDDVERAALFLAAAHRGVGMLERRALGFVGALTEAQRKVWRLAAETCFGKAVCIASGNKQIDGDAFQLYGFDVKVFPEQLEHFLGLAGVPKAKDVVPATPSVQPVSAAVLDGRSIDRFLEAFAIFAKQFPDRAGYPIVFYRPLDEKARKAAGFTRGDQIWIALKEGDSLPETVEVFKTLVHESRHIATKAGDYDRKFVNAADDEVAVLAWRGEGLRELEPGKKVPALGSGRLDARILLPAKAVKAK